MNLLSRALAVCAAVALCASANARPTEPPQSPAPVDLVIALDVSGSMSGLIESAKQRLWDIVNELSGAQPQPQLRVAIVTFGNPNYGAQTGYVRIDQPFSQDLDLTNQTLFSFQTDGGDEYVARAVHTSLERLDWSTATNALRIIFVAGNEAATQDPQFDLERVTEKAVRAGVTVNAIYCGDEQDADAAGWRDVARISGGFYASINQQAAAVANVSTPMDQPLAELNEALNDTYLPFGKDGHRGRANQLEQDEAVAELSNEALASRAITKSSRLYASGSWDLVDAVKNGTALDSIPAAALPEPMRDMTLDERQDFVGEIAAKREAVQAQIQALGKERRQFIANQRAAAPNAEVGLDDAMKQGLRKIAESQGYEFAD